jgi:Peptidase family M28
MVVPPPSARRRPRPGSLERPVNGRLYRGTWLLLGLPLLVAAFSVARPTPLPPSQVPPIFDGVAAAALATELAHDYPNRFPGSVGALQAANWFRDQLHPYGLRVRTRAFSAVIPGFGRARLENLSAEAVGRSPQTIVVMAHRDDDGTGPGADDNASGTAALIELARAYSLPRGSPAVYVTPAHTILFLSTDGGAFGQLGAAEFVAHAPERGDVIAVVNLDAIAGHGGVRLQITGDTPRSPSGVLVATASARIARQTGRPPARPGVLHQLIDLALPFSLYEQAPFLAHGIPALTVTRAGDRPPNAASDTPARLNAARLGQVGRAVQDLVGTLDQGLEFAQGTSSYVDAGRMIRGWAVELVLIASLLPFLAAAIDLFARCRRRHIPLAPALRSYRSRLAFWLAIAALFELFGVLGAWPGGAPRPLAPTSSAAREWPAAALLGLLALALPTWLIVRERLLPRRPVRSEEELAGQTAALLSLAALALVVVALNPFALIFLLPSVHAWLWLPNVQAASRWVRAVVLAAGFLGPALLVGSFATRFDLGWDAPWYVLELRAVGYLPLALLPLVVAWIAASAQLAAVSAGRYAPYPSAAERPPRGPVRESVRRVVLAIRARRRATAGAERALEG